MAATVSIVNTLIIFIAINIVCISELFWQNFS